MSRSSSGLGRRPLKAEITSSNLVRDVFYLNYFLPNGKRKFSLSLIKMFYNGFVSRFYKILDFPTP